LPALMSVDADMDKLSCNDHKVRTASVLTTTSLLSLLQGSRN
jgi:hypothetical protein